MKHRVLIVEDHGRWRRHVSSTLERASRWEVVGEVSDGIDAVHKARDLKPDVILLDVGLPSLDGIGVARQVLAQNPSSRILFVSAHQSLDIAGVALSTGARGYIVKSDAGRELLPAMDAIVDGRRFVSAKLGGRAFTTTSDGHVEWESRSHEAGFYPSESSLLDGYATFAEAALSAGNVLVIVVTSSRRDGLHQRLQARGIDIDLAAGEKRFVWVDPSQVLSTFVVDSRVDEARFWDCAHAFVMDAARASKKDVPGIATCGDCGPTLLQEGLADEAVRLEQLWDDVIRTYNVDAFCAYSSHDLRCDDESQVFRDLRAAHSAVHLG